MDFNDTKDEAKFRDEVSSWLSANADKKEHAKDIYRPAEMSGEGESGESSALKDAKAWQAKKYDAGWACLHWPKDYGGRDATPMERVIWGQEESKFKVPGGFFEIGQGMAGPVLMLYATEEQKKRYLPPMAKGEEIWCQLFSEPGAGSDLAGIKTKAELDGDTWTINGQKVWTSGAHYSDYGIIVTRSDFSAPKHKGLTYFFLRINMDFNDTKDEAKFRDEVNSWLSANADKKEHAKDIYRPAEMSGEGESGESSALKDAKAWQAKKYDAGWACLHWPKDYGGRDATPMERVIWGQEESKFKVPGGFFEIGQGMAGPVLMLYATEEQKKRYLPPMAKGEEIWCQLFSEPGAGSDLAGIKTKAELDGDTWTINGQKVWTSGAHYSDYGIIVTRSDFSAPKHKGLTYFFLDMKSPGVEVRPIKQITGGANFNEVYFTDVKIPDSQRLGEIGDGWKVSLTTLMNERLAVGDASGVDFQEIFELAKDQDFNGDTAISNGAVREKLADWYCEQSGLKYTKMRNISALSQGSTPGPEASITKIVSANKLQDIANYGMDLMDNASIARDEETAIFQGSLLGAPLIRIAGGTDEVLKNIIAEQVLGMPQDIRVDKNVPFNEIPTGSKN